MPVVVPSAVESGAESDEDSEAGSAIAPAKSEPVVKETPAAGAGAGADAEESKVSPKAEVQAAVSEAPQADDEDDDVLLPEAQPTFDRNEVRAGDKYREDAVHVYGLDFLRTEQLNEIFSQFEHRYVEWINDSAANIVFRSKENAKKALESLSYPKAADPPWRRTPDILVNDDCPPVFLQMRFATPFDQKKGRRVVPKVMKDDAMALPPRNRAAQRDIKGGISVYRDGMSTDLLEQAGLIGKRAHEPMPEPSEEERQKRRKRTERFSSTPGVAPPREQVAAAAPDPKPVEEESGAQEEEELSHEAKLALLRAGAVEVTEDEATRRRQRAERFGKDATSAPAGAHEVGTGVGTAEGKVAAAA